MTHESRPDRGFVFELCLAILFVATCPHAGARDAIPSHDASPWKAAIEAFEAADKLAPPPRGAIEFIGSSSIRMWTSLEQDFPGLPVFNRGFGGSQLADAVYYADRIVIPYAPRQVVIYAGANDIDAGKSPGTVYGDFVALATAIRTALPQARIAFIAISPNPKRWSQRNEILETNRLIAEHCRLHGMTYIDTYPLMLGSDGLPRPDIFIADGLHMNEKGYAIWREAVKPHLH